MAQKVVVTSEVGAAATTGATELT